MKEPTETKDELKRKRPPFTIVENSIIKDTTISKHAILVYLVLCMFADSDTASCFPGYKQIANLARCSRSTVQIAIQELVDKGYVNKTVRRVSGKKEADTNLYIITGKSKTKRKPSQSDVSTSQGDKKGIPSSGTPIPESGTRCTGERYTGVPSIGKELDPIELDPVNKRENVASQPPSNRDIYHFFEQTFKKANPEFFQQLTKKAYGKEGQALKRLEAIALNKPDPLAWAKDFIATVHRMKKSGDKMYGSWPLLASTLASHAALPRILEAMKRQGVSPETERIAEEMFS